MPASTKLPPLECLFTIDEETGLTGMLAISCSSWIYRAAPCACLPSMPLSSVLARQGFSLVPTHQQTATTAEQGSNPSPPQVMHIVVTAPQSSCEAVFPDSLQLIQRFCHSNTCITFRAVSQALQLCVQFFVEQLRSYCAAKQTYEGSCACMTSRL